MPKLYNTKTGKIMLVVCSLVLLAYASTAISKALVNKPNIVFDVTKPLETILKNSTKIKSYIENLAEQNVNKGRKLLLLYNLDCNILLDCVSSFPEVENILTTVPNHKDMGLILSITLPSYMLDDNMREYTVNLKWVKNFDGPLLFNFPQNTTCDKLPKLYFGFIERLEYPSVISIGYNEDVMSCKNVPPALAAYQFVVVHHAFGSTVGVTESFGLFQRRWRILHTRQKELRGKTIYNHSKQPISATLYYPIVKNVGDLCHQQLLASYSEKLVNGQSQDFGIVVPAPSFATSYENSTSNRLCILGNSMYRTDLEIPGRINEIYKRFNSVYMHYAHWKQVWRSGTQHSLFQENFQKNSDIKLEIFLDFYYMKKEAIEEVELELEEWQTKNPFSNVFVGTLLFYIKPYINIKTGPIEKFAQRMSSNYTIGCAVKQNFTILDSSTAPKFVDACNNINGSLYILQTAFVMNVKEVVSGKYTFYYENTIRKELEQMKEFGQLILQLKPKARIVLNVQIFPTQDFKQYKTVTNFCNDQILYLNEYYEAITSWANCNNLETVIKSPIDDPFAISEFTWLSHVRPVIPGSFEIHLLAKRHPYFVFRNYPNNMNNWTVDPCIQWDAVRPDVNVNYFDNSNIGAVFYANQIRQNESLTADEYKIMLQFILYRFDMVEIVLQNNTRDLVVACNWLESQNILIDLNNTVLLNYKIPLSNIDPKKPGSEFDLIFEELKENKFRSIEGIHFDFSINHSSCIEHLSNPIFKDKILLAETQRINIKLGIVLEYTCCMDVVQLLVFQNETSRPILLFLEEIDYLVCQESHQTVILHAHMKVMGNVLDSQLYLKKAFQEFSPKLELYSRISLQDLSSTEGGYSDGYMKTVSHFKQFGTAYDIKYLIVEAFDSENEQTGWWKIQNFSDLSDPQTFIEKEAESFNRITWRPEPLKNESISQSRENSQALLLSIGGVLLTICLILSAYFYLRYKKIKQFLSDEEVKEFLNGRSTGTVASSTEVSGGDAEYLKFNTEYKLHISDLHLDIQTILGKGNFGTVYKGTVKELPAAIKTPNKNCSKTCFKSVLSEVKVLCYIGEHSNIVGFLGAYTNEIQRGVLYIATEFCANGSLEAYLRKRNKVVASREELDLLTPAERECAQLFEDLCTFSIEIASGMGHLERRHVVHGDLSVRNVLLDENYTCKIADFGLSRKLYDYQKYVKTSQEPLPWKWMAYESLTKMEFTSKSDVWSYGVTVWEIFSLGKVPYCTINWTLEFSDELKNGLRLSKPEYASQEIYMKLLECWNLEPVQRPTFTEMTGYFKEMNKTDCEYVILDDV